MGIKSTLLYPFARYIAYDIQNWSKNAVSDQNRILADLLKTARLTQFGRDHHFEQIKGHKDFRNAVPIRDYEAFKPYVERIKDGEKDILWPGKPIYFAKTSGTTSGAKYIPITKASIPNHISTARNALFNYCLQAGILDIFDGKVIFLSGSPELEDVGGIPTGRLSGIVNHRIPAWLRSNQLPSYETNCIEDWEEKLSRIVDETIGEDMRLISGIPPWVQMYYEQLLARSGKSSVTKLFPNFKIFVYGGVNYTPYKAKMEDLTGHLPFSLETYPASEGFIAFQDSIDHQGLLLNTRSGIFYEFVALEDIFDENPTRLTLEEVELNKDYALIINNNAGLWGYNIGDTVRFVSKTPYRLIVSGRVKHYISAFGEHVIGKEVERALEETIRQEEGVSVIEFTVAPQVSPPGGVTPYHEWFIEFGHPPGDMDKFAAALDRAMIHQNIYYKDLREGNILQKLKIRSLEENAFRQYMAHEGKLGGQNKVPRLSNDRSMADQLTRYIKE
ncbi:MAG: GH3 auxin-responsive promoter family protein [Saprospiraceae bacterium]|nr:GH3 auxin-responsive promoter family protein [Saprospiraceae bacterium]